MIDTIMIDNVFDAPIDNLVDEEFTFEMYAEVFCYYEFREFHISFVLGDQSMVFSNEKLMEILTMDLMYFSFCNIDKDGLIDGVQYVFQKRKDLEIDDTRN